MREVGPKKCCKRLTREQDSHVVLVISKQSSLGAKTMSRHPKCKPRDVQQFLARVIELLKTVGAVEVQTVRDALTTLL